MRRGWLGVVAAVSFACGGGGSSDSQSTPTSATVTVTDGSTGGNSTGDEPDPPGSTTDAAATTSSAGPTTSGADTSSGGDGCTFCDGPNQRCVEGVCETTCQGQLPDPCAASGQVCDHVTGECADADAACLLSGEYTPCGGQLCGPGSVCDDQGECLPYPPCAGVACSDDGACWGTFCSCERSIDCETPTDDLLNGPFSTEISDLEFADDCTAWMVTLRSGTDFLRRLTPDGEVTEWAGVSNLNMGEVAVLKTLTPPPGAAVPLPLGAGILPPPPEPVKGIGEVALTYICCSTCGCFTDPPQGVARLVEEDMVEPLPLVIPAVVTDSTGPFGSSGADAGPFGLTWGIDRVLYVGNAEGNGNLHTADLEMETQQQISMFENRVTAAAPLTEVHIMVATLGGQVFRYNVATATATEVVNLGDDVTNMSFDAFSGLLYVSLRNFDVVTLEPFTGVSAPFQMMPARGRVTVSPNGRLYYSPIGVLDAQPISSWDVPDAL